MRDDSNWFQQIIDCTGFGPSKSSLHLAVFVEPYLSLLMAGIKTMESRFSQNQVAPFNSIWPGDLVLFKRTGGEIVGIGHVGKVEYVQRGDSTWRSLRSRYEKELCVTDDSFWEHVSEGWFASLIWFDRIKQLPAMECDKQDRRGWVIIKQATDQLALEFK